MLIVTILSAIVSWLYHNCYDYFAFFCTMHVTVNAISEVIDLLDQLAQDRQENNNALEQNGRVIERRRTLERERTRSMNNIVNGHRARDLKESELRLRKKKSQSTEDVFEECVQELIPRAPLAEPEDFGNFGKCRALRGLVFALMLLNCFIFILHTQFSLVGVVVFYHLFLSIF